MLRNLFGGDDPVSNAIRNDNRTARQTAAKTKDSAQIRAGIAAGRGKRSIGTTRKPFGK